MSWPLGWSYTAPTRVEMTIDPDGEHRPIGIHEGWFYFNPALFGLVFVYLGFRPTPTWSVGWGDEGIWGSGGRFFKKIGFGNLGAALRRAK